MSAELKRLQTELRSVNQTIAETETILSGATTKLAELKRKRKDIQQTIEKMSSDSKPIVVSEHAILRYIERHFGVTRDEISEQITKGYEAAIRATSNGKVTRGDGVAIVIKNNVITTINAPDA